MREFMAQNHLKLEVTKAKVLPLCRDGDQYLMDDFRTLQNLDDSDLYDINRVQIFLKVTTLSDSVDAAGLAITVEAYNANKLTDRSSSLQWPRQPLVTTKQKNLWQKALHSAYTTDGHHLHNHLGAWTQQSNLTWNMLWHPTERVLSQMEQGIR